MAFRITGILGLDGSGFFGTLSRAEAAAGRFATGVRGALNSRLAGLFTAGAIGMAIRKTTEYAGKLTDLADRTDSSVESLQRLDKAAKMNGSSLETLISFWDRLNDARGKALAKPDGMEAKTFARFGISQNDLATKTAEDLTRKIVLAFQSGGNIQQLTTDLQNLGGRGVGQLVTLFRAGLDQMTQDMKVMTTEESLVLDDLDDKFSTLWQTVAVKLAPAIAQAIPLILNLALGVRVTVEVLAGAIVGFAEGIMAALNGLKRGDMNALGNFGIAFAQNSFATGVSVAEMIKQEIEERRKIEEALAAKANAMRNRSNTQKYTADAIAGSADGKQSPFKALPIQTDILTRVGNFMGASNQLAAINQRIVDLNRLQLVKLTEISNNTRPSVSSGGGAFPTT